MGEARRLEFSLKISEQIEAQAPGDNMNLSQSSLSLEEVVINSELLNRRSKAPDYEAECQALLVLAGTLTSAPETILQKVAETALQLCRADSAGISLLDKQDGAEVLRWEALAGVFSDRRNSTMPRDASPCGTTIDRNATQLMYMAERIFPALRSQPPVVEALLIPFRVAHKPIGTMWIVAHDERRKFDSEDERIIKRLAQFASAAWQLSRAQASAEVAARDKHQEVLALAAANEALKTRLENRMRVQKQSQQLDRGLQVRSAETTLGSTTASADFGMLKHGGKFVANVSHDFNNILSVIQAYAALILSNPAKPKDVIERAEVITATVEKGVALVRQLFAIGRMTETKFRLADINDLLQRTTKWFTPILPKTIVIAADLDPRVPMIEFDAALINQAILNLCVNARDAMPAGGTIFLQTGTTVGGVLRPRFSKAGAEQYVHISVADTGVGMEADVRSRIFESYFTTKDADQGTGLGLSIVHHIVTEHRGFIEVTSEPGCGATFHIYLPIPDIQAAADPEVSSLGRNTIEDRLRQRETVLYAEDDARLSDLMRRLLEGEGFKVLTARDGFEAVDVYQRHKDLIAIAILDFGLGQLNGWDAFQMMKKINPKLKGILASGYVSGEVEARLARGELNGVIQKPYAAADVLATIKRTIQGQ